VAKTLGQYIRGLQDLVLCRRPLKQYVSEPRDPLSWLRLLSSKAVGHETLSHDEDSNLKAMSHQILSGGEDSKYSN
jgi:hypothetical protein